jgi:cell division protein FtsB
VATKRGSGAVKGGGRVPRARGGALTNKQILGRAVVYSLFAAFVAFAIQGGEYGTTDLVRQRRQLAAERAAVESLAAQVEDLQAFKKLLESDAATQERIAREEFGMVKPGEILYRFVEPAKP